MLSLLQDHLSLDWPVKGGKGHRHVGLEQIEIGAGNRAAIVRVKDQSPADDAVRPKKRQVEVHSANLFVFFLLQRAVLST